MILEHVHALVKEAILKKIIIENNTNYSDVKILSLISSFKEIDEMKRQIKSISFSNIEINITCISLNEKRIIVNNRR